MQKTRELFVRQRKKMAGGKKVNLFQIFKGFLFMGMLAAGLGLIIALVLVVVGTLFGQPWRSIVLLLSLPVLLYGYYRWVWFPLWTFRSRKQLMGHNPSRKV
jgi:hypothetical protein